MNLKKIEAIKSPLLIKHVLSTCWNFADETSSYDEEYGRDIHIELFNRESYTVYTAQTESDIDELGVWNCIKLVINHERFHFGEVYTEIEPFKVANTVNSIASYHLLGKSEHLTRGAWDRVLTAEDCKKIQKELRAYIKGLGDWTDFWTEVCDENDVQMTNCGIVKQR